LGAAGGGFLFDAAGWQITFSFAGVTLLGSSLAAGAAWLNWKATR
jgi:hypothetical protein